MKRWLITLPLLLASMAGVVRANYLLMVINTGALPTMDKTAGPPQPGQPPTTTTPTTVNPADLVTVIVQTDNGFTYDEKCAFDIDRLQVPYKYHHYLVHLQHISMGHEVDLYTEPLPDPLGKAGHRVRPNLSVVFEEKRTKAKPPLEPRDLAEWALTHGLVDKYVDTMKKLAEDPKTPEDKAAVANFRLIHERITAKPEPADLKAAWPARLTNSGFTSKPSDHYCLFHNSASESNIRSRLDRLEEAFKTFYYWHAMKGKVLPVPKTQLVVILGQDEGAQDLQDFRTFADGGEARLAARHEDAFFARREGILYLSVASREPNLEKLAAFAKNRLQKLPPPELSVEEVLTRRFPERPIRLPDGTDMSSVCLAVKGLEADTERLAVSHFGARQLAYAAGMLPRYVEAPEWVQYGLGSFFETPLGSPWATPTVLNTAHLKPCLDVLEKAKGPQLGEVLKNVVTDEYFRLVDAADESEVDAATAKARALAWGLTYYIFQRHPDRFWAYRDELDKMPRDVPLDGDIVLGCFARAVDAVDAQGKVDAGKLRTWAEGWRDHLKQEKPSDAQDAVAALDKTVENYKSAVQAATKRRQ